MRRLWKPAVLELDRLLAMVSRFVCCACIPLAAVYSARNMVSSLDFCQVGAGNAVKFVVKQRQGALQHFGLALHSDQRYHRTDGIDVRSFDRALPERRLLRQFRAALRSGEQGCTLRGELRPRSKLHQTDTARDRAIDRERPI